MPHGTSQWAWTTVLGASMRPSRRVTLGHEGLLRALETVGAAGVGAVAVGRGQCSGPLASLSNGPRVTRNATRQSLGGTRAQRS